MSISAEILGQKIKIKSCKIGDSGQNVKIKISLILLKSIFDQSEVKIIEISNTEQPKPP